MFLSKENVRSDLSSSEETSFETDCEETFENPEVHTTVRESAKGGVSKKIPQVSRTEHCVPFSKEDSRSTVHSRARRNIEYLIHPDRNWIDAEFNTSVSISVSKTVNQIGVSFATFEIVYAP